MAQPIRFLIELFDRMSAPAGKASAALDKMAGTSDKATAATEKLDRATLKSQIAIQKKALEVPRLEKQLAKLTEEMRANERAAEAMASAGKSGEGWASKLTAITTAGRAAFDVIRGIGSAAINTGEALFEAAARQDQTTRAFKNLLGDGGPALQKYLATVTRSTAMTTTQLEQLVLPLARQGFGTDQIQRLLPAVLDVQARGGDAGQAAGILAKIASTGKIEGEAFGALGLKAPEALATIGRVAGITDPAKVQQAISAGKIGASQILEGVLLSIAKGGRLGDAAVEAATSPAAALNRFRNLSETIFARLAESPALPKLAGAVDRIVERLTSDRAIEGFQKSIEAIADAVLRVDWAKVGDSFVKVIEALAAIAPTVANIATFGAIGDEKFQRIRDEEGGFRGFVSYLPFIRALLDTDTINGKPIGAVPSANDFLARADGSILRINSQDDVLGFKPGGPVEAAFSNGSTSSVPATGGNVVSLSFGDITVGPGQNRDDFKQAIRDVVVEVWQGYALADGVG